MTRDQAFLNAVLATAVQAQEVGLVMQVELASGDVLSGIPTVEVDVVPHAIDVTHPASFSQKLTVERTEFLAQEVRWFCIGLP